MPYPLPAILNTWEREVNKTITSVAAVALLTAAGAGCATSAQQVNQAEFTAAGEVNIPAN